jgi:menaquinone-dependent protoporphyrinogen IX oxidase
MKTLIAYASKGKTSENYAHAIEEVLINKGLEPDVIDLMKGPIDASKYDIIIVGFGVRAGKPYKEALNFLKSDFTGKKVAVFVSTLEPDFEGKKKYIDSISNDSLKIMSSKVLGGKFKILWKTIDKTDMEKAKKWAIEMSKKF